MLPQASPREDGVRDGEPRVLVAGGSRLFADAARHSLGAAGFRVVGVEIDIESAIQATRRERPDVVIVDVDGAGWDEVELARGVATTAPQIRLVALAGSEPPSASDVFHGTVSKHLPTSEIVDSVRRVLDGERVVRGSTDDDRHADSTPVGSLTPREREVLTVLAGGASSDEVAERLGVTGNTARKHIQNVLTKLQVHSRLEAVTLAIRHGLVRVSIRWGRGGVAPQRLAEVTPFSPARTSEHRSYANDVVEFRRERDARRRSTA